MASPPFSSRFVPARVLIMYGWERAFNEKKEDASRTKAVVRMEIEAILSQVNHLAGQLERLFERYAFHVPNNRRNSTICPK